MSHELLERHRKEQTGRRPLLVNCVTCLLRAMSVSGETNVGEHVPRYLHVFRLNVFPSGAPVGRTKTSRLAR